jgi:hypothetical protein
VPGKGCPKKKEEEQGATKRAQQNPHTSTAFSKENFLVHGSSNLSVHREKNRQTDELNCVSDVPGYFWPPQIGSFVPTDQRRALCSNFFKLEHPNWNRQRVLAVDRAEHATIDNHVGFINHRPDRPSPGEHLRLITDTKTAMPFQEFRIINQTRPSSRRCRANGTARECRL